MRDQLAANLLLLIGEQNTGHKEKAMLDTLEEKSAVSGYAGASHRQE